MSIGIQLGARYGDSPLIAPDGAVPPADDPIVYRPTGVPGGRAPHAWLSDGSALFDRFGPGFTLLCLAPEDGEVHPVEDAAAKLEVPIQRFELRDPEVRDRYEADCVLIRPDQHIAWRGNQTVSNAEEIVSIAVGAN